MTQRPARPGTARRWLFVLAGAVLALTAGIAAGEWWGWPFLAGPLQRGLSQALHRGVDLGSDQHPQVPTVQVRFFGGLRLQANRLVLAAPAWSTAPHMLLARDVSLTLRYTDLWRAWRGAPLRIQRLQASALDAELERLADGRASWQFGATPTPTPAAGSTGLPRFGHLQVAAGVLRYRDAPLNADLEARLSLANEHAADSVLTLAAGGRYRGLPLKVDLQASGGLPWAADDSASAAAVPVTLRATVGRASLRFDGRADDALHLHGLTGRFHLQGPSLAAVGDPLGVTLPTTAAFRIDGALAKQGDTWRVVVDDATVGASRLNGAFSYERGRAVPMLAGRLGGRTLMLKDLGPVVGTTPAGEAPAAAKASGQGKVLPDRPFDLNALRVMDANVLVDIDDVDLNTALLEPLRPLRGHLQLAGGVLTLTGLDARTAQGRLMGDLRLDGRAEQALWTTELRWSDVRLERWLHQARKGNAPPYVSGRVDGHASLKGQGRSTAQILASLQGQVRADLRDGAVSHLAIEAAGLDLAQSLGVLIKGDDALPVPCAVADLVASQGVLRPRVMVLDTRDSAIWVDGTLSLATEALDLRAVVVPKDFSLLTLRTPLHVGGSFAHPEVSLEKAPLGRKLAASILLGLVNPLAALIPLVDPGNVDAARRGAAGCASPPQRAAAPSKASTP